jgi:hypothetical protein
MIRTNKVIRQLCQSWHFNSEWTLGRYAIHRSHGVVARAWSQKQHLSIGDYLRADGPFESKIDNFDPVLNSIGIYGLQLYVETFHMWTVRLHLEIMATDQSDSTYCSQNTRCTQQGGSSRSHRPTKFVLIISRCRHAVHTVLHVAEVHIWHESFGPFSEWSSSPPNGHPHTASHLHVRWFLGPHNSYTCHNSMVSRNGSTTKGPSGSKLKRYKLWSHNFF